MRFSGAGLSSRIRASHPAASFGELQEGNKLRNKVHLFTGRGRKETDAAYTAASSRSSARLLASLSPSTKALSCVQRWFTRTPLKLTVFA